MSKRIRTPLKRRWQLFRTRTLQGVVWLAAVAAVAVLWRHRVARLDAPAMVEARQATVASAERATITSLAVELFDEVKASQVLVRLDDSGVRASLEVAVAELKHLQAQLKAAERQLRDDARLREADEFSRSRNYAMRVERLRIEKLDRTIELENDQVELQRLAATLERQRALRRRDLIAEQEYDDVRFQHEALQKKVKATQEAVAVIDGRLREAMARQVGPQRADVAESITVALAPLREALGVQLKRVDEIKVERESLVLTSPLDGVVTAVHRREGEAVRPGEPIVTVADPDPRSMQIVSFIEQGESFQPAPGMEVEVRRRTRPVQVARARIMKVSPQVELIPPEVLGNPSFPRWGVRVLIDVPASMLGPPPEGSPVPRIPLRPGELLDVRYFASRQRLRPTDALETPRPAL